MIRKASKFPPFKGWFSPFIAYELRNPDHFFPPKNISCQFSPTKNVSLLMARSSSSSDDSSTSSSSSWSCSGEYRVSVEKVWRDLGDFWRFWVPSIAHTIHGTNGIFTYMNGWFFMVNVGKYSSPTDPMGRVFRLRRLETKRCHMCSFLLKDVRFRVVFESCGTLLGRRDRDKKLFCM